MKKLFSTLILLFTFTATADNLPNIVALVNDRPITLYEFQARKKLIFALNNVQNQNDSAIDKQVSKLALNSLIDDSILDSHAEKMGGKISDEEIDEAIRNIEERNKMPKGGLVEFLKNKGADVNSFRSQIKGELIKMNIFSYISRTIKVSPREVDSVILSADSIDPKVSVKIFTSKDKSDKTLHKMYSLQKKIKDCTTVKSSIYEDFADVVDIEQDLSTIDRQLQPVIKDLEIGKISSVFETEAGFKLVVLCNRQVKSITAEENKYVVNLLTNKKMSQKAIKFLDDLRKKAYVKIVISNQ